MAALFPGSPEYPGFVSLRDTGGLLPSQYNISANQTGLNALRTQALTPGANPWIAMQMQQQNLQDSLGRGSIIASMTRPGQRGTQAIRGGVRGLTSLGRQSGDIRNKIAEQAEGQRQATLATLPGMELSALAPQEFNIQNALAEKQKEDLAKMSEWQEKMKAYAASGQARALAASGKK